MWLVWVHDYFNRLRLHVTYAELLFHPITLLHLVRDINAFGAWEFKGEPARGFGLLVFWLGEAAAILSAGVLLPLKTLPTADPTCRECGARCKSTPNLPRFATARQADLVASIENRAFASLTTHAAPGDDDAPELVLRLLSCPRCNATNILTLSHVAWYADANGRASVKRKVLVNQLLITPAEAADLKAVCAQIQSTRSTEADRDSDREEPDHPDNQSIDRPITDTPPAPPAADEPSAFT